MVELEVVDFQVGYGRMTQILGSWCLYLLELLVYTWCDNSLSSANSKPRGMYVFSHSCPFLDDAEELRRSFFNKNKVKMVKMVKKNCLTETVYIQCIKHIYTVIQFIQPYPFNLLVGCKRLLNGWSLRHDHSPPPRSVGKNSTRWWFEFKEHLTETGLCQG